MIFHLVATAIFWLNGFPPYKPVMVLSNTKGPGKLILGTIVDYKKFSASRQVNMFRYIKKMNPVTPLINIEQLEQLF